MPATAAVRARSLTKTFGDVIALDGVDLDVPTGQIHGLVGPNGAGKTTLLGLLLGLAVADRGELEILGAPAGRTLGAAAGVSGFVDGPGLYPGLSARANLATLASLRPETRGVDTDALLARVGLAEVAGDPVRGFSLGMRQRLGLAAALLGSPRLLVLDEPANGLDPAGKHQVHQVLTELVDAGTSVVLSSHRMDDLTALCDEVTLLAAGRVVFSGPVRKLMAESGRLDYRLVVPDRAAARRVIAAIDAVTEVARPQARPDECELVVRCAQHTLDDLVVRLVHDGVALRELGPVMPPLEAAFLALTGGSVSA